MDLNKNAENKILPYLFEQGSQHFHDITHFTSTHHNVSEGDIDLLQASGFIEIQYRNSGFIDLRDELSTEKILAKITESGINLIKSKDSPK